MSRIVLLGLYWNVGALLTAQTYTIDTVAGGALPVNVAGLSASVGLVSALALDANGNVFFASPDYNVVLRLDAVSHIVTLAAGNGIAGFSGDDGPATAAEIDSPQGLAVDSAGNLFLSDTNDGVIREVSNGVITTLFSTADPSGPPYYPSALALDSAGNLYFTDPLNSRVVKVSNGVVTTVAGNLITGFSGDDGPAANASLNSPNGLAVDSQGNVYIADSGNNCVREVSNGTIFTIAQVDDPLGLAVDSSGNLFVSENDGTVSEIANGVMTTAAGNGNYGFSGDGGPALSAQFYSPVALAVDASDNIFIADQNNERVREVSGGIVNTIAGNGTGYSGDNGPAAVAQLYQPDGIAVDGLGNLLIADTGNGRVREVANGVITTVAGNGTAGYTGDGGPAISAELGYAEAVATDAAGDLFIDDGYGIIREVSGGVINTVAGFGGYGFGGDGGPALGGEWGYSESIALDTSGKLYISDGGDNRVRVVWGGYIYSLAGNGTAGYAGEGGPAIEAELNSPTGVAVDIAGNLYIADTNNSCVRQISPSGIITTVAGTGVMGFSGDDGPAASALIGLPSGIAVDALGSLYIADQEYEVVRKVSGGVITTIAGGGATLGDGGSALNAQLGSTLAVAVDASENVYIADYENNRVRVLTPSEAPCTYSVSPGGSYTLTDAASTLSAVIQTNASCTWAVQNLPDWITLAGSPLGSGPATVALEVAPGSGLTRSAQISIAGVVFTVNQVSGGLAVGAGAVTDAANYSLPVAPGSVIAIFGTFELTSPAASSTLPIPTSLGGLSLTFGGSLPAPLFYAGSMQVNAQVPWELAGQVQASVIAAWNGQTSAPQTVSLAAYAPGIFTLDASGSGTGAILDSNYVVVSPANPTTPGAYIQIYCTGLGPVSNQPATGAAAPGGPFAETTVTPSVSIGEVDALVVFSGLAPGTVGLYQVNVQVPAGVTPGNSVQVMLSIGGVQANLVTTAVQ